MIRLFISDFDGTLLDGSHTISETTKEAIIALRNANISFMPASGRDYKLIMQEMDKVGIKPKCIALNGGGFYDNNGELLISNLMNKQSLFRIDSLTRGYDIDKIYYSEDGRNINLDISEKEKYIQKRLNSKLNEDLRDDDEFEMLMRKMADMCIFEKDIEKILAKKIYKIDFNFKDMQLRSDIWDLLNGIDGIVVTSSFKNNLEINSLKATKGLMAQRICEYYGYAKEEVVVIGDGINDISMLSMFPNSYAMNNATDEVKQHANFIADSNINDGVAKVIYDIIKKNASER